MAGTNTIDERTGSITYSGTSEITKGNHNNMPSRTDGYLDTDERGHIQASSLSGSNNRDNIVPQSAELNHQGYNSMEQAERAALKDGSIVNTEKTAYVSNQPGNRPDAFIVNDTVTYNDGRVQDIHLSFSNLTNAEQEGMNAESSSKASDLFDAAPNPGDSLRNSMTANEYAELMEETDAALPNIGDMYEEHISGNAQSAEWSFEASSEAVPESTASWGFESSSGSTAEESGPDSGDVSVDAGNDDGADISSDDE
ncbi:MAG: DNA/RNA non-specific endonuclease [Eubacteriales bacterium]|nr:DNA/RNA non-specific endonuclease [Eubacteriales bacterium]